METKIPEGWRRVPDHAAANPEQKPPKAVCIQDRLTTNHLHHLLEDVGSTSRIQHILAFLEELALQVPPDHWTEALNDGGEAIQGLGWILRSCKESLAIHDELVRSKTAERRVEVVAGRAIDSPPIQ